MLGIIGGTGLYKVDWMEVLDTRIVGTPFGEPSAKLSFGKIGNEDIVFLPRHGESHQLLPSEINYRANIWALKSVGVKRVISFSATGSLREAIKPGEFALPSQYFDFVKDGRTKSFFGDGLVAHITTAEPICSTLRNQIYQSGQTLGLPIHNDLTYGCVDGPRLGTRAESFFLRDAAGCDLVGMTNIPEVFLAREAQMCYSSVAIPTDYDCWMDDASQYATVPQILKRYSESLESALELLKYTIINHDHQQKCECQSSLSGALMFDESMLTGGHKIMMDVLLK
ncbi:MAG: MTAP family purine nucleoside phosphorylase [Candidatus Marinimicrobia bacterium]|jgi:5'-methylthioadenosine phosphorylase|nr:MTAP family purine nucleoside phosphorylase [Candidatus Neomarinimicrobiota bacterium]MBT3631158.1 MTAP family purine nucleoside phosphorylase [Candidatus Neomarinimicrobiota bacterium]MBT3825056.1 MTAP family purine nucleoside phosphorylase [Candidatus Neomarinimicrobiota bacterium]MBT4131399.1 MTAP family purine nucleoside phosphorylase [Candidatus Neomarinimicrobiota bacterium]MBT4296878.1 MTAP family purine nucleoside phosphorylase [Candidatus Neomarinimicrobiota bacterium]